MSPEVEVVVFTGQGSIEEAVEAMKQGAWDFLTKPIDRDHLLQVLRRALDKQALVRKTQALEPGISGLQGPGPLIAESGCMTRVLDVVHQRHAWEVGALCRSSIATGWPKQGHFGEVLPRASWESEEWEKSTTGAIGRLAFPPRLKSPVRLANPVSLVPGDSYPQLII